jgi:uncharacterized damage-inducible protein DinB
MECCSSKTGSRGPALQIISETLQPWPPASDRTERRPAPASFPAGFGSISTAIFPKKLSRQGRYNNQRARRLTDKWIHQLCSALQDFSCGGMTMATKPLEQQMLSTRLIVQWEQICQKLAALAEEVPASKFDFQPAKEVRTVAAVLRHVAFWNNYVADSARGKNPDGSANELPEKEFSSKAQVIDALKRSAADAAGAFRGHESGMTPELAETLVTFIEHNSEHYGQLVIYARLNGIVPPASRG